MHQKISCDSMFVYTAIVIQKVSISIFKAPVMIDEIKNINCGSLLVEKVVQYFS
jgi:hypothetical protein